MKKTANKPLVVFVFSKNRGEKSTRFGGFAKRLEKSGATAGFTHATVALEDLIYIVDNNQQAHVLLQDGSSPFSEASFVYFKSWESMPEEAAGLAIYLESNGIPYVDSIVGGMGVGKLPQLMHIWATGTAVTPFAYGNISEFVISKYLPSEKYIIKGAKDEKGKDNVLANANDIASYIATGKIVQPYIENAGDYRVLTYGFKARGALYRTAQPGNHLNNTSAGATSQFIDLASLDSNVVEIAQNAARATGHEVAGVDILPGLTGELYVLEVNQGSQIVTGHSTDRKIAAFNEYLNERLQKRHASKTSKKKTIGRHISVDIPTIGLSQIHGKIDTGAYRSALSAKDIKVDSGVLYFCPVIDGQIYPECSFEKFDIVRVVNTSGIPQKRYHIDLELVILGEKFVTSVSLADRTRMKSPLLIGRRALSGRFIVNVELSRKKSL